MKKVELHLHLDGSVNTNLLNELLKKENIVIDDKFYVTDKDKNLSDYLKKFDYPLMVMQTSEKLTAIAYQLTLDLQKDDVIYAEIRFAPFKHTKKGLSLDDVVNAVLTGLKKGPIKTSLILCCMRDASLLENKQVVDLAFKYNCAIDLAGDESLYATSSFNELFSYIKSKGVPYTIHAGEASGKQSIKDAISFGTKRIGHGVRDVDQEIINLYKDEDITLEVCPTSNLNTNLVLDIKDHPIYELYKAGVKVSVNTDNRTVSNTDLNKEYQLLKNNFPFKDEDFKKMNEYAIMAAFITDEEKKELIKSLD